MFFFDACTMSTGFGGEGDSWGHVVLSNCASPRFASISPPMIQYYGVNSSSMDERLPWWPSHIWTLYEDEICPEAAWNSFAGYSSCIEYVGTSSSTRPFWDALNALNAAHNSSLARTTRLGYSLREAHVYHLSAMRCFWISFFLSPVFFWCSYTLREGCFSHPISDSEGISYFALAVLLAVGIYLFVFSLVARMYIIFNISADEAKAATWQQVFPTCNVHIRRGEIPNEVEFVFYSMIILFTCTLFSSPCFTYATEILAFCCFVDGNGDYRQWFLWWRAIDGPPLVFDSPSQFFFALDANRENEVFVPRSFKKKKTSEKYPIV